MRDADLDAAATDPPIAPLAGAVLGLLATAVGLAWVALSLVVSVPGSIGTQLLLVVGGLVCFVASMLWWSPDV